MSTFEFPFQTFETDPCNTDPCPSSSDCFICGYDPNGCGASGCADYFTNQNIQTQFLNCFILGFSSKLGIGGSESTVNVDLLSFKEECPPPNCSPSCSPGPNLLPYDGRLGYIYTFIMGNFCFRGILSNHTYSEDNGGYKYRLTLSDGRNLLSKITIILNTIYDRPPSQLEHTVLNTLYFLEPSIDDCDGIEKCKDFMKSGANYKGIFLKKALTELNGKQIQIPISKVCLKLKLDRLINIIPDNYRTSNDEMSLLDLIELACEEVGHDFFIDITEDNELEIIPVDYTKPINNTPLLTFINQFSIDDIAMTKEYGQEMTYEKNKRLIFGDYFHYLTTIDEPEPSFSPPCEYISPVSTQCNIVNPPYSKLVTRDTDAPIDAESSPSPECSSTP